MRRLPVLVAMVLAACGAPAPGGAGDAGSDAGTDAAIDPGADAGACGTRTGQRGKTSRTIEAAGLTRTYHVYLPAGDPTAPMPLVFVHHGYTMSGQQMFDLTEYAALADAEGIALAFPDGQGGPLSAEAAWQVGPDVCPTTAGPPPVAMGDDFALLDAITADITADQCIDRAHVYVTGFSMGGYFAHHAGCMRPDLRAVAPAAAGTHDLAGCPSARKPIIMFHGGADPLVPAGCTDPAALPVLNVEPAAAAWAAQNGCATTTTSRAVRGGTCVRYDGCPADGQVELCRFPTMGHCWPGAPAAAGLYACPGYASATALAWEFFRTYAW